MLARHPLAHTPGFCAMLSLGALLLPASTALAGAVTSGGDTDPSALLAAQEPVIPARCAALALRAGEARPAHPAAIDDLLRLRDFGVSGLDMAAAPGFAVSPDGRRLAVQVRQAEPATNTYCQAILVFDLRLPALPLATVMMSEELSTNSTTMYGMNGFPSGSARPLTPQWSPDGRLLAFVQRRNGRDGLFVVQAVGGDAVPVATPAADVATFAWVREGTDLEFETNAPLREAETRLAEEGRDGYRYDDRFWMLARTDPFARGSFEARRFRVPMGPTGPIGPAERLLGKPTEKASDRAWVELDQSPAFAFRTRVHAVAAGAAVRCDFAQCEDAGAAWWSQRSQSVLFLRREGFASSLTGIYRWRPGQGRPRRLTVTPDAIIGCTPVSEGLLCGRERSAWPRDIVAIDARTSQIRQVIDLNPEWHGVAPARITRLHWTNRFGIPAIGDLVLPGRAEVGKKLPLVVVQYTTRGFLRGGTGDEYPIRAIAAAGFAVLSISRPLDYNTWLARAGKAVDQKELMENWTDRANAHDSLLKAVDRAAALVPLDIAHLAITGLSDGASTATYALIHSRRFSLALLSTCCEDPEVTTTAIGPAYEQMLQAYEYPLPSQDHVESWRQVSPAMNASRICAEIQVQAADREARMALASIAAWRRAGVPVEMYVFPDEYHVKWQAAHRAAVYRRNLDTLRQWRSRRPVSCPAPR